MSLAKILGCFFVTTLLAILQLNPAYADDTNSIVVMTYNIRLNTAADKEDAWPNRAATVMKTLQQADTFGLQEVLKGQLDDLVAGLPEYDYVGVGRDDGKEKGEYVPVFYRKERFEKIDSGHFWLSEHPETPGSKGWDTAITRMVTWVVLKDKKSSKSFLHLNTHFDHRGPIARLESAKLIKKQAASLHPELPAVLTGDFNCDPQSEPYKTITNSEGVVFIDTLAGYSPKDDQPAGTWNAFKAIERNRIDYIFTIRNANSANTKILDPRTDAGRFGSDHLPIITHIQLP